MSAHQAIPSVAAPGWQHAPVGAFEADRGGAPTLSDLSMRDEEIVLRSRAGELPHDIARALDHDLLDVMRALNRALAMGIVITPGERA